MSTDSKQRIENNSKHNIQQQQHDDGKHIYIKHERTHHYSKSSVNARIACTCVTRKTKS